MLLPQSYQYPNLSEGVDSVGGQLRGDKGCPFSGVTNILAESGQRLVIGGNLWLGGRCRKVMLGV